MTPFAWLLGLVLPACGAEGAAGLPIPVPMDMTRIERPASPNTFLAGPSDMKPKPDVEIATRPRPATEFFDFARAVFERQPRTYIAAVFPERLQVHYVVRSALMNFPDLVTVQVTAAGEQQSALIIWSRSVYGRNDFGVNRQRTEAWIAALQQAKER